LKESSSRNGADITPDHHGLDGRGRGLQTALLPARLAAVTEAGCEYAVVVTQGGTASQRNCERLGFRVAYSKVTAIRNLQ